MMRQKIGKIAKKYNLSLIIVFGSQSTGKIHKKSDIDVAILPKNKKDLDIKTYSELINDLEKGFGERVDITQIPLVDPLLLHNISETGQLLFGTRKDFDQFKRYAFKRFQDYSPYFKLEERAVHNLINQLVKTF